MRRKPLRRNPEWSWDILDKIWPELKAVGGKDLLPILRNPPVLEHGSGQWGVAMPTGDPRWTLKLTTDRGEAQLMSILYGLGLNQSMQGLARSTECFSTGLTKSKKGYAYPVFVYWREASLYFGEEAWAFMRQTQPEHRVVHAQNQIIDALDVVRGTRNQNIDLSEMQIGVHLLIKAKLLRPAAREVKALAQDGVVITDFHYGNWGVVARAKGQLTLMDPGLVRLESEEALQLARAHPPTPLAEAALRRGGAGVGR